MLVVEVVVHLVLARAARVEQVAAVLAVDKALELLGQSILAVAVAVVETFPMRELLAALALSFFLCQPPTIREQRLAHRR